MNIEQLLHLLKNDLDGWNKYRKENNSQMIELISMDLRNVDFKNANLRSVNFSGSNLSHSNFNGADISGAVFSSSNISFSNFSNVNGQYCTFHNVDLYSSSFNSSDLLGSEFNKSNMASVKILDSNISQCDFRSATLTGAVLDSRKQLKNLIHYLSDEQISGVIFQDERYSENFKKDAGETKAKTLEINLEGQTLTPFNLSYLLLAIEGTYNNLFYLSDTESDDIEEIKRSIQPYYQGVGANEALMIKSIKEGSIIIELTTLTAYAGLLYTLSKIFSTIGDQIISYKKLQIEEKNSDLLHKKAEAEIKKSEAETDRILIENKNLLAKQESNLQLIADSFNTRNKVVEENKMELLNMGVAPLEAMLNKYDQMGVDVSVNIK